MFVRAYLRASTAEQDATRARAALDAFAAAHGFRIAARYVEHESGTRLARPELFRLLDDCGPGDVLLVEQVDRLSRLSAADWSKLRSEIEARQVRIVSLNLPTSWNLIATPDDFTARMFAAVNAMMLDVLARLIEAPSFTDMTSSGSTVRQVLHGGQMMLGPQVDALGPDTRLVTLTAGGNDVGYVGDLPKLAYLNAGGVIGGTIGTFWKGPMAAADRDFDGLEATLRATLREIARRSPKAKIVVVTYPNALPEHGTCAATGLTTEQASLMREVAKQLAAITRKVAAEAGATMMDDVLTPPRPESTGTLPASWLGYALDEPEAGMDDDRGQVEF